MLLPSPLIMETVAFNKLPSELFKEIARHIHTYDTLGNRNHVPTSLFLINKGLNTFLRVEQVRNLHFYSIKSLTQWLDMIEENPSIYFPNRCAGTNLQYDSLLSYVENLKFESCNNRIDPDNIYTNRLLVFIQNCTHLHSISIESNSGTFSGLRYDNLHSIIRSLPLTIQHIQLLTDLTCDNALNIFRTLVDEWLPRGNQLLSIKWRSGFAPYNKWLEKIPKLFEQAPMLQKFDGIFPSEQHISVVFDDVVDVALRYCPELYEFNFREAPNIHIAKISEWFINRGSRISTLELRGRRVDDEFLENMARNCPNIKKIDFNELNGFSMRGVWAILDGCRALECIAFVGCRISSDVGTESLSEKIGNHYNITYSNSGIVMDGHDINKLRDLICEQRKPI